MNEQLTRALWQAMGATVVAVIAIKWLTGLAYLPLLLIAIVVMALAFGMSIRLQRVVRRS